MTTHQWPAFSHGQLLQRLPAHARAKYAALQALAADSSALAALSFERQRTIEERRDGIARRLGYLDRVSEHATIAELEGELGVIEDELQKISDARAKRDALKANCQQVLAQLDAFIGTIGLDLPNDGGPLLAANVKATPRKGENLADAIKRVRSEISDAKGELARTKIAPPTPEEIKQQLREHVQALVHAGTPTFTIDGGKVVVSWPDTPAFGEKGEAIPAPSGSASKLLCCLFPDQVFALLTQGVDDVRGGISAAARPLIIAEIEDKIMELEHVEEALVTQALAAGIEVHRRSSASGYALLGLDRVTQEHLQAAE